MRARTALWFDWVHPFSIASDKIANSSKSSILMATATQCHFSACSNAGSCAKKRGILHDDGALEPRTAAASLAGPAAPAPEQSAQFLRLFNPNF
jgi:hypothetical protein